MAHDKIKHRVAVSMQFFRIAPKHVEDLPPIVLTPRNLAVAVVVGRSTRVGKPSSSKPSVE